MSWQVLTTRTTDPDFDASTPRPEMPSPPSYSPGLMKDPRCGPPGGSPAYWSTRTGWRAGTRKALELIAANTSVVDGRPHVPVGFRIDIEESALGAVVRQALVMMIAISGGVALTRTWPRLFDLVTSDTAGELPTELALGLRLVVGGRSRAAGPMIQVSGDGYRVFYELSVTPFSWNLSVGAPGVHPVIDGADVSGWFNWAPTERVAATLELPVGIVVTPYPGDFRTADEVHAESEQLRREGQAG